MLVVLVIALVDALWQRIVELVEFGRGHAVAVYVDELQLGVLAQIKSVDVVAGNIEVCKFRVPGEVKTGKEVAANGQSHKGGVV